MIIHHMSDGSIRKSIEGLVVPSRFEQVYILAQKKKLERKKEFQNGNSDQSRTINKK